jgi:hypothetical protein
MGKPKTAQKSQKEVTNAEENEEEQSEQEIEDAPKSLYSKVVYWIYIYFWD